MKKPHIFMFISVILAGFGNVSTAAPKLPPLTPDEQAELKKIIDSIYLASQNGYNITQNTKLAIATSDFGEKQGCIISIHAQDAEGKLVHPRWSLKVQTGKGIRNIVWTSNRISNNAGEIRLMIANEKFLLTNKVDNAGGRGMDLNQELLDKLFTSESAKALSGVIEGVELSSFYDLNGFRKAYQFASEICPLETENHDDK